MLVFRGCCDLYLHGDVAKIIPGRIPRQKTFPAWSPPRYFSGRIRRRNEFPASSDANTFLAGSAAKMRLWPDSLPKNTPGQVRRQNQFLIESAAKMHFLAGSAVKIHF